MNEMINKQIGAICISCIILAPTPARATSVSENPAPGNPVGLLVLGELLMLSIAAWSTVPNGNRPVGAVLGVSGAALVAIPFIVQPRSSTLPEFTIPYGAGLLATSAHNFKNLEGASKSRRFRENAYALNLSAGAGILTSILLMPEKPGSQSALQMRVLVSPDFRGMACTIRF